MPCNLQKRQYASAAVFLGLMAVAIPLVSQKQSPDTLGDGSARSAPAGSQIAEVVRRLCESGRATSVETIRKQLERASCQLSLPSANSTKLTAQELRRRAQQAHVRVGWVYQCIKCNEWHVNLSGGYALTTNGAVATCYHVASPPRDLRIGVLIVAAHGKVFSIVEVLAANRYADACIVQVKGDGFTALPLNTNVAIGDTVYCFSNLGERNAFTPGVVKSFLRLPERRLENVRGAPPFIPLRIQVSVMWGIGDSGSALLDECGNAIGHASTLTLTNGTITNSHETPPPQSIFHEATSAKDVLSLTRIAP